MQTELEKTLELANIIRITKNEARTLGHLRVIFCGMGYQSSEGHAPNGRKAIIAVHPNGSVYDLENNETNRAAIKMVL